ncbi:MAG: hypothetical protein RJA25_674 [Bacteroidota bacterium]|jgi:phosphoglycolate phosphatase
MQHFIFDLDGTITFPQPGILGGYRYAFEKFGITNLSDEALIPLIGPPLRYVFSKIYHFSEADTEAAIQYYKDYYYGQGGMYDAILFDGMRALFQSLKEEQKTMYIATHKSAYVEEILAHFNVLNFFSQIEHYDESKNILTKETMIQNIIQQQNISNLQSIVMIGDREHDLSAAKNMNVRAVGVLYGFGTKEELEQQHPDYLVENVSELSEVLHQM